MPDAGFRYIVTPAPNGKGFIHYPCVTNEAMVLRANELDAENKTVYFGCASYKLKSYVDEQGKTRYRTADNAGWAKTFWLDLDCSASKASEGKGYATFKEAGQALKMFCSVTGLPIPTVVLSGGGIHAYWPLETTITKEEWKPVADKLKALTHSLKLLADDSRTSDIASILRPVKTHNWKPEHNGKEVVLKYEATPIAFELFSQIINAAHIQHCAAAKINTLGNRLGTTVISDSETPANIARVKSALSVLDPNCDRSLWRNICWAVQSLQWNCSEELARSWSMGALND